MTDQTEAPDRVWIDWEGPHEADHSLQLEPYSFDCKSQKEYIRKDLSDAKDKRIAELEALVVKAVAIANRRGVYVPTTAIECRGDKCRESWCASCCGDDHAEAYVRKATDQDAIDRAALAALKGGG